MTDSPWAVRAWVCLQLLSQGSLMRKENHSWQLYPSQLFMPMVTRGLGVQCISPSWQWLLISDLKKWSSFITWEFYFIKNELAGSTVRHLTSAHLFKTIFSPAFSPTWLTPECFTWPKVRPPSGKGCTHKVARTVSKHPSRQEWDRLCRHLWSEDGLHWRPQRLWKCRSQAPSLSN